MDDMMGMHSMMLIWVLVGVLLVVLLVIAIVKVLNR